MINQSITAVKSKYAGRLFVVCVILEIFVTLLSNVLSNTTLLIYGTFLIELLSIFIAALDSAFKLRFEQNEKYFLILFISCQLIMYIVTSLYYRIFFFDAHKLFLCVGMMYACYVHAKNRVCSYETMSTILKIIIVIGVIATIYNLIDNYRYFVSGNLSAILIYSFNFRSFFTARAAYGTFLNICAIITLLWIDKKGGWLYWVLFAWFAGNIIITAARAQIIALIIGTIIFLSHSKKYKKVVFVLIILGGLYLISTRLSGLKEFINKNLLLFDHSQYKETDISTGRFELWRNAFNNMNPLNYLIGNGIGSKDTIMEVKQVTHMGARLSSFHSGYVDLFFETGLLGILIWFFIFKKVIKEVCQFCPIKISIFFISLLFVILSSNIFDSCNLPFTTDTLSTISSYLVIALPLMVANRYKLE